MKKIGKTIIRLIRPLRHWQGFSNKSSYLSLMAAGIGFGYSAFHYMQDDNFLKHTREFFPLNFHPAEDNKNFISKIAKNCKASIVLVHVQDKSKIDKETGKPMEVCRGSGFVVKSDGWILTNAHNIMLKKNYDVEVITEDGILYPASVVDVDLLRDLALLKIDNNDLKPLKFGNSDEVNAGEWVVALGNHETLSNRVTAGVISSVNRDSRELGLKSVALNYIQTDASLTYEHAGGPLVNLKSEVIGVNNLRVTPGISFALPSDYVKDFLMKNALQIDRENAKEDRYCCANNTCCGITTIPITTCKFKSLSTNSSQKDMAEFCSGVLVWNVVQNSPAHKAGLLPGDLITHIDNKPVRSIADLYVRLFWETDNKASLTLHRRGSKSNITVQLQ